MSSTTLSSAETTTTQLDEDDDLSRTEWIVIIVVLVIILIVLIIAIAKCLEFGKSPSKSLMQNDEQSMRSETVTRSVASTRSRPKSMRKLSLNAEIHRLSAGRASRSAEYGVVIKDIKKTVQEPDPNAIRMMAQPPPGYNVERSDTLRTYQGDTLPTTHTLSSPPTANLIVNEQYATQGLAPPNSKAVFVAPDELYATPRSIQPTTTSTGMLVQAPPGQVVQLDRSFPLLRQPTVVLQ